MTDVPAGTAAPVADAPAASPNAVPATEAPALQDQANDKPVESPKTYTEEENRRIVSERLKKEQRRLERTIRAELRAEMAEKQLAEARSPKPAEQPKGKPDPKDFQDFDSYQDALLEHKLEQRLAKEREESRKQSTEHEQARSMAEQAKRVRETLFASGKKEFSDFEAVALSDDVPITGPMAAALMRLPQGHKVWYHLGQNPDEAARIAELPDPVEQMFEIRALESKVMAPPKPTNTPAPIVPGSQNASVKKDYRDMTTAEHVEAWRTRKKR